MSKKPAKQASLSKGIPQKGIGLPGPKKRVNVPPTGTHVMPELARPQANLESFWAWVETVLLSSEAMEGTPNVISNPLQVQWFRGRASLAREILGARTKFML